MVILYFFLSINSSLLLALAVVENTDNSEAKFFNIPLQILRHVGKY